ncbi:hypothetical protein BST96_08065 [Oceanicoccus sagamiensis]|uniref:Outer membrane protein beta-barrel domain-containing protein n=2 Tax=Oceanicoccus sagamiensis TaxID=716816 RepID=A0A1X9NEV8_9GAMM|nr:hypothetical protein BST96_08065 [Oceanicoccus sagamiensis]
MQGRTVAPSVNASVEGDTWEARLNTDLTFNNFNRSEYDSDDQDVTLVLNKRTEIHYFRLEANAVRDSTRTSEQDTSGIVTNSAIRRESEQVSPQWSYTIDDLNSVLFVASVSETEYKSNRFTNYDYDSLRMDWTRVIQENLRLTMRLNSSQYKPEERVFNYLNAFELGTRSESTSYGAQLGADYSLSENWSLNGFLGSTQTDQEYFLSDPGDACNNPILEQIGLRPSVCDTKDFSSSDLTADISIDWSGERMKANFKYSIQNQPSSQGYEIEYERYSAAWKYLINRRSTFDAQINYGVNQALDSSLSEIVARNNNRDFGGAKLSYNHSLTERWGLGASYQYQWQDRDGIPGDAESHTIQIAINYSPTDLVWSR